MRNHARANRFHRWSIAVTDDPEPRAVLSLEFDEPSVTLVDHLTSIGFRARVDPLYSVNWSALDALDDRRSWADLRQPHEALVILVDRASGLRLAFSDINISASAEALKFTLAAERGIEVRLSGPQLPVTMVAKVTAFG